MSYETTVLWLNLEGKRPHRVPRAICEDNTGMNEC